jgi:transcriptional regulator with XRE-family HTH domain
MSQRELAEIVGLINDHQVSTHERSQGTPSFLVALSYEAIFGVPVAELFPGFCEAIVANVELRLVEREKMLLDSTVRGRRAALVARQLEWLHERRIALNSVNHE